jgi:Ca2+-binding RTX toxin-like protein/subtilisin-like proprotein convertase family protein
MPNETVQTQDGITGQLATETDLASYDFAEQQLNGMQTPTFGNFSQDPDVKVYFVLQDGTRNDANNDPNHLTNVGILKNQLELIAETNPNIGVGYTPGVGTEGRGTGTIDAITGGSYDVGVGMAYMDFARQVKEWKAENPNVTVRVINVSFSRGVPEAAGLTQLIDKIGVIDPNSIDENTINQQTNINAPTLIQPNTIAQAVVLFDPVATGEGLEHDLVFPDSVISGFQINANDEFRTLFPVTNLIEQGHTFDGKFLGVTTAGAHTNIGGSYLDNFLSNLNFNLAVTYINSLLEEPILSPISDSSNPVIHHSEEHQWFYKTKDERIEINDLDKDLEGVQKISERDDSLESQFTYKTIGGSGRGISTAGQYKIYSEEDWKFAKEYIYKNLSESDVTYFQNAEGKTFVAIKEEKLLLTIDNDALIKDAAASLTKFLTENHQLTTEENTKNWFQKVGIALSGWVDSTADFIKNTAASVGNFFGGIGDAISTIGSWVSSIFTSGESDKTPDPFAIDNSLLNLTINTDKLEGFATNQDQTQTGNVIDGGDYSISGPIENINGDGVVNVMPWLIAGDGYRPGNQELSSYSNFSTQLNADFAKLDQLAAQLNQQQNQPQPNLPDVSKLNLQLQNPLANLTNNSINARTFLNIDPVVLDLNGDGVKLTSYNSSEVTFDVDNDGKQERTGWVSNQDGILVEDVNQDGKINNITETISEYYNPNDGSVADADGKYSKDGLAALKKLDSNHDGKFNNQDSKWNDLKVWVDASGDGVTDAGELKTLTEAGIKEINLNNIITATKERNEGNIILSKSTYTTTDGQTKQVAAVDFTTNPIGYEFNDVNLGKLATSEEGTKSLIISNQNGETVTASDQTAQNIFGNIGNDSIIGDDRDNWLSGSKGSDTLKGGKGDDILIIDSEDKQENIDGGEGRDIVIINSDEGVSFNLTQSNIETTVGGNGDDVLIGGGTSNVFIDGGSGDDIIIGGAADDALAGSDGNDYVDGGYGDDVIRGHRGADVLIGGLGDDYLEGGLDNDKIFGGEGNDIIMEGAGNDEIDGGEGYDLVKYSGSYKDYKITRDGTDYKIQDLKTGNIDSVKNVEGVRFTDATLKLSADNISPLPVADLITLINKQDTVFIAKADLLNNDLDVEGDVLTIISVQNVVGGAARLVKSNTDEVLGVEFTPDKSFIGNMSFDYDVKDSKGAYSVVEQRNNDGSVTSTPMKARVTFKMNSDPSDSLYAKQWYLSEINVQKAWEDYTGEGIKIGVFEKGDFNINHKDLNDNTLQSYKDDVVFRQVDQYSQHKTTVAGVIAAERNGDGIVGVAYNAKLDGYSWDADETGLANLSNVDIANNSWGNSAQFGDNFSDLASYNRIYAKLLENSVKEGRAGLGTVNVFAGGNARQEGDNVNYHNLQNSRFVITTGSINQPGDLATLTQASTPFSNPGDAILVSAPGSNINSTGNLLTNENGSTFLGEFSSNQGTSFSAPIISGVVALMLQANPNLGYRDVQKILALSARQVNDPNTVWQENGAKNWNGGAMHFSHDYGFGIVDAAAAVRLAETWKEVSTFYNEKSFTTGEIVGDALKDNAVSTKSFVIENSKLNNIETVEVKVNLSHLNLSDLTIRLISASGTSSILMDHPQNSVYEGGLVFNFSSRAFLGEKIDGEWKLEITDSKTGNVGYLNSWKLSFFGKLDDGKDDVYVYTDEIKNVSTSLIISDNDGGIDSINAAAVNGNNTINLNAGQISVLNGREISIASNSFNNEYYDKKAALTLKKQNLDAKNTILDQQKILVTQKQAELAQLPNQIDQKYQEFQVKDAQYKAAVASFNESKLWFDTHEHQLSFRDGSIVYHFFKGINDGNNVQISADEYTNKVNDYNAKLGSAIEIQNQRGQIITDYNALITKQTTLPREIDSAKSAAETTFAEISNLKKEIGFIENYIDSFNDSNNTIIENAYSGDGNDRLIGNEFDNKLFGGRGENTLTGNGGSDIFIIKPNAENKDVITDFKVNEDKIDLSDFATSFDKILISQSGNNTIINLTSGQIITLQNILASGLSANSFMFNNFNDGTVQNDDISGTNFDDIIDGKGGNDVIRAGNGNDTIYGGDGNDVIYGGKGNDTIFDGGGKDVVYGDDGDDVIHIQDGNQPSVTISGAFSDIDSGFFGGSGSDQFVIGPNATGGGFLNNLIYDFEVSNHVEKIDLRAFSNIHSVADLKFGNITINNVRYLRVTIPNKVSTGDAVNFTLKAITQDQLSNDNFIFLENKAPASQNDNFIVNEDNQLTINISDIIANDSDIEDGVVIFDSIISQPKFGSLTLKTDGKNYIYTPNQNFNGIDSFEYKIKDSEGRESTSVVEINVLPLNDTPTATLVSIATNEDNGTIIDVLASAFDIDGDSLAISGITNPSHGTASIVIDAQGKQKISYVPTANFNGTDQFTYTISDSSGAGITKTLNITINAVNDAPVATNDNISLNEDSSIKINALANDSDVEDGGFEKNNIAIIAAVLHGTIVLNDDLTFTYTPDGNYFGTDSFSYQVKDKDGAYSNTASVYLNIASVNDAPTINGIAESQNLAAGKFFSYDLSKLGFNDADGDTVNVSVKLADGSNIPSWLTFDSTSKILSGTPSTSDDGSLSLQLIASDGSEQTIQKFEILIAKSIVQNTAIDVNVITVSAANETISASEGVADILEGNNSANNLQYVKDDIWVGTNYVAWNPYSNDIVQITGMNRSFDAFDGGAGNDTLYLTANNDAVFLDDMISKNPSAQGYRLFGLETINGGDGNDIIDLSSNRFTYGDATLNGGNGNDVLWGNDGNDTLNGGVGNDNLQGGRGSDTLSGDDGNDIIKGYNGNDLIIGGKGIDIITGGAGNDQFIFSNLTDSTINESDVILDFIKGEDKINLSNLGFEQITNQSGNSHLPHGLEYYFDGKNTVIDDPNSNFAVKLAGDISLDQNDFVF